VVVAAPPPQPAFATRRVGAPAPIPVGPPTSAPQTPGAPSAANASAGAPPAAATAAAAPAVQIGTIEVRVESAPAPPAALPRSAPAISQIGFDDYLAARSYTR
jgi:hypothetical protein